MPFDSMPESSGVPFGAANLLRLADVLENLPPDKRYNHTQWSGDCGTTACAMGWAGILKLFGFTHDPDGEPAQVGPLTVWPDFRRADGTREDPAVLAMETFEISVRVAHYLFTMHSKWEVEEDDPSWPIVCRSFPLIETKAQVIRVMRALAKHKIATAKAAETAG